ncbi:MAG: AAA family ATPase, partial [Gammaproteobacteria bacterium]|nr:AAA family ATPase [Gammaproteobacteria bacterium]
ARRRSRDQGIILRRKLLETGGKEILEAKDDIGRMLFAAGTGIAGLRDRLDELSHEADELWARRARRRKYHLADAKLAEAKRELREQTLTTRKWQELKSAYEMANRSYEEAETEFKRLSASRKRLSRIRRVYPHVRRKAQLELDLEELGDVIRLPEDSGETLDVSERKTSAASERIDTLNSQLARVREEQESLVYDERLLARADDIGHLHERRIEVRRMQEDLPLREADLKTEQDRLRGLAAELGWRSEDASELIARIPNRATVATARILLNKRGACDSDVRNKSASLQQGEDELAELQKRLQETEELDDVAGLEAAVKAVRQSGDIGERVRNAKQNFKESRQRVDRLLSLLHPRIESPEAAVPVPVPARAAVENHRVKVQDWERRNHDLNIQSARAKDETERSRETRERLAGDGTAITLEALREARDDRDQLWRLVKKKHVEQAPVSTEEAGRHADMLDNLASAFESAAALADERADQRFDNVEAAAQLSALSRQIRDLQAELKQIKERQRALALERERLDVDWKALWEASGVRPRDPEAMLEWLLTRGELLDALARLEGDAAEMESREKEERDAKGSVLRELASIGVDCVGLDEQSLAAVRERADGVLDDHREQSREQSQLRDRLRRTEANILHQHRELEDAKDAWCRWNQQWSASLQALGLEAETNPDAVEAQLDLIDQMREVVGRIENLRHERIDKISGEIAAYKQAVAETLEDLADDLAGSAPDEAVLALEERLNEAKRIHRRKAERTRDIDKIESDLREQNDNKEEARRSVAFLRETAGVDTNDDLREAIGKSDRQRQCQSDLANTSRELEREGDGLSISELEAECQQVDDPDQVAAQEDALETDLEAAQHRLTKAAQDKSSAEQSMLAVDGDAEAARAEAKRQEALADIRHVSERYARARSSAMLLQWAIDRYRREKQAPLLKRAGELFAEVTSRSFADLRVDYDHNDQAYLTGLRSSGEAVPVSGMSSGTADQLYLALRVAAIEDYLDRSEALPFVADDLFINFDDRRAGAGFRVLGELARKTQVLFFTHHTHLLEVAREALGGSPSIVDMDEDRVRIAG